MLAWFRRHALILMVFLGSAAMVIFGLGSVFDSFARSFGEEKYENPVVAKWQAGDITQAQTSDFYRRHSESYRLISALIEAASEKSGGNVRPLAQIIQPINGQTLEQQNQGVMRQMLLAQVAEDQGMVVSDEMVDAYLTLVSGDVDFSPNDLYRINSGVNGSSLELVKEHLKRELMAMQMSQLNSVGMELLPNPTDGMQLFGRTSETVECQVVPLAVEDFIDKVTAKPTDSELRELYSEGKDELKDPSGEKPGFKIPRKINVQHLVASEESFVRNEMAAITDEEVQAEYDRLVEAKDIMVIVPKQIDNSFLIPEVTDLPPALPGDEESDAPDLPDGLDTDAPADPSDAPTDSETSVDPSAASADSETETAEPTVDSLETPEVEVAPESDSVPPAPPADESAEGGLSSLVVNQTRDQRVSLRQELELGSAPATDTTAGADSAQDAQSDTAPTTETTPNAPEVDNEQTSAVADQDISEQADDSTDADTGEIGGDIADVLQETETETEFKPLVEVAENIRRSLALPRAAEEMSEAIEEASYEVQDYADEYDTWLDSGKDGEQPAGDFEAIAKDYKLSLKETGLVDPQQMEKDPLGGLDQGFGKASRILFYMASTLKPYEPGSLNAYMPTLTDDYLVWITENEEPRVPSFDECKADIEAYWYRQQAVKLAMQEAESIKVTVNQARDKQLTELYVDQALSTGQFAWLDSSQASGLASPGNVEYPSEEFMKVAFALSPMEAGAAIDAKRETVYVIQSIGGARRVAEVGRDYLENQLMKYKAVPTNVRQAAQFYNFGERQKASTALQEGLGFKLED